MDNNKITFTFGNILAMIFVFLMGRETANNNIPFLLLVFYIIVAALITYFFVTIIANSSHRQGAKEFYDRFIEKIKQLDDKEKLNDRNDGINKDKYELK